MKEINVAAGTTIAKASEMLVDNAPAFCIFNDIRLEATDASVNPQTIVDIYNTELEARRVAYTESPEGQRAAENRAAVVAFNQALVDRMIERLPWLDCSNARLVIYWLGAIAEAADDKDVTYDHKFVVETFKSRGWEPGANCTPNFDENDPRNYAGYIVGQWLESRHPMVLDFIERWRAKFDGASSG